MSSSADARPPKEPRRTYTVVRLKSSVGKTDKPTVGKELFRKSGEDKAPASDRRIAEIEASLQNLLDEVKSLKGAQEKPR